MSATRVKCPTCQRELEWATAPFRPFCSARCRLIDLGAWLTEQRAIPDDAGPPPEGSASDEQPLKGSPKA